MTKERAEQLIVISLFIMLTSTVGGSLAENAESRATGKEKEKYYGRKIVGGFLTIFFASIFAEIAPEAGALLAVSSAGYAFFHYGLPAITKHYQSKETKAQAQKETEANLRAATPGPTVSPEALITTIGGQAV